MNDKMNNLNSNDTGIEIPALTSKPKKWLMGAVITMTTGYLLLNLFLDKPKKAEVKAKDNNAEAAIYPIPKLQDNPQELRSPKSTLEAINNKENPLSLEDPKLMLLRQNAPI